ncbi:substrate-binding domain-containing protein [Roseibium sp. SCP14]|uniref:LacI family DNA-binding transcriptional regulator n=1 Tax=Roseibium sp. SCP14 TaxID=3141375 RepID=UPI003338A829
MKEQASEQSSIVTADDVAEAAGVSRWTVARAFKAGASISQKSRDKILSVAAELGYTPDLLASSLASERTNQIALLVDDFHNPHKLPILNILTEKLQLAGFTAILVNIAAGQTPSDGLLHASQRRVDAAILIGTQFDESLMQTALGARKLKKLVVFARESEDPNTLSVSCDNETAVGVITDYVISSGYKRPIYLAGPDTLSTSLKRKRTFVTKMSERGYSPPDIHSVSAYDPQLARNVMREILNNREGVKRPDIVLCENDVIAVGAIDVIRYEMGLRIPEDIAVIGFDDISLASSPAYNLTTYRQPLAEMADCLIEMLQSPEEPRKKQLLLGEFVKRSSA